MLFQTESRDKKLGKKKARYIKDPTIRITVSWLDPFYTMDCSVSPDKKTPFSLNYLICLFMVTFIIHHNFFSAEHFYVIFNYNLGERSQTPTYNYEPTPNSSYIWIYELGDGVDDLLTLTGYQNC